MVRLREVSIHTNQGSRRRKFISVMISEHRWFCGTKSLYESFIGDEILCANGGTISCPKRKHYNRGIRVMKKMVTKVYYVSNWSHSKTGCRMLGSRMS